MLFTHLLPADSALNEPLFTYALCASLIIQHGLFHLLSRTILAGPDIAQQKRRAWILTTLNGLITSLAAVPFLWDLLASGFDLHAIRLRTRFANSVCAFFLVYLMSDLGLGSIYYRKLINLSSGWIHHTVYLGFFSWWVHRGWGHIVVAACIFELPTFIMGIASIHPPLRSNVAFTSTFFVTRIFLHIALLASSITPHGRSAPHIDGSWGVATSLIVTLPMHLWWGYKCALSVRRRMHKRKMAARAEREKEANAFANVAGQAFNGFGAPDVHSAVNTPLPTPGPSPAVVPAAFAKAAAAASRKPIQLVLGRNRKGSAASAGSTAAPMERSSSGNGFLQVPDSNAGSSTSSRRSSLDSRRSSSEEGTTSTKKAPRPFTQPVPPPGATADSREPFLAIRSAAEGRDRARRLVADGVRRMWFGAPVSWRRQFEDEARLMDGVHEKPRRAKRSLAEASDTEPEEDNDDEAYSSSRAQRARALLRRGVLRAVRRAINGRGVQPDDLNSEGEVFLTADNGEQQALTDDRALRSLDLGSLLKLSGLPQLPPDLVGQPFEVRPMEVERREGQRRRSLVADLRRKMEIRARDVVVWD